MKKILVIVIGLITMACISRADEKPVKFEKIPVVAQNFIKTNFADNSVVYVAKDDDLVAPDYEVVLDNGTVVQFSNSGNLEKIEAYKNGVPQHLIPDKIRDYVTVNYPGVYYREYEIDRGKYEVKLSNGLELTFNSQFTLIEIDD